MNQDQKIHWKRISVEAVVIVASILLAFAIEAWWDTRIQEEQRQGHLSALARDFDQMHERAMASHSNAERAVESGIELLTGISNRKNWNLETAINHMTNIFVYEVFSPSTGGYESLISSGNIELFTSNALKQELASFFGSFDDMRVSEQLLVNNISHYWQSTEFGHLVGVHRLPVPEYPKFEAPPVEDWNDSEYLANMIGLVTLGQKDVLEDYQNLLTWIESIREALTEEAKIH